MEVSSFRTLGEKSESDQHDDVVSESSVSAIDMGSLYSSDIEKVDQIVSPAISTQSPYYFMLRFQPLCISAFLILLLCLEFQYVILMELAKIKEDQKALKAQLSALKETRDLENDIVEAIEPVSTLESFDSTEKLLESKENRKIKVCI